MTSTVVSLTIDSDLKFVAKARDFFVNKVLEAGALSGERLDDLRLVLSEAVTNAIEANLSVGSNRQVSIDCEILESSVNLKIVDAGPGMAEMTHIDDIRSAAATRPNGQIGIPLMQHLSNKWSYSTDSDGTVLSVILAQAV